MRLTDGRLCLSASDLSNHLGCRHLTGLNRARAEGRLDWPQVSSAGLEALRQRGFAHERQYLASLRDSGLEVLEISTEQSESDAIAQTTLAMARGCAVIAQGALAHDQWFGRVDVLRRIDKPSRLGPFSYEAHDTKLARETKGSAVLQLCLYSDLLEKTQGVLPEALHVVPPGASFTRQSFRVLDYLSYYRWIKAQLQTHLGQPSVDPPQPYPEPTALCEVCQWAQRCEQRRRADDHLSFVAGITRLQRRELEARQIDRLAAFGELPLPLGWKPERGSVESLTRAREQARLQLQSRGADSPLFEPLPLEPGRGFHLLPAPSPSDVFFDLEGDPFAGEGGQEYLFGDVLRAQGVPRYTARWAFDRAEEKAIFEAFIDRVMALWAADPAMHVYHYAPYEPSALKRLMGRYGTREEEVDRLLRGGVFVDLYRVVRQGLRVGVESYSIKRLEPLFRFERQVPLPEAGDARHWLEQLLEAGGRPEIPAPVRETVRAYNEDDCLSALQLRDWLELRRADLVAQGSEIPRPSFASGEAPASVLKSAAAIKPVHDRLVFDVPADPAARSEVEQGRWLLAQLLEFYRREEKVDSWQKRDLAASSDDELFEERRAVARLTWLRTVEPATGRKTTTIERYAFEAQDCDLHEGDELFMADGAWGTPIGKVTAFSPEACTIDVKKTKASANLHPTAVYAYRRFDCDPQEAALLRLGAWVADHDLDARGSHRAARDLLLRRPPRLADPPAGPLRAAEESAVEAACRLAGNLRGGVLPIQGPPGCGKTYAGVQLICALVAAGKKVGVTATSHKVIDHLLQGVVQAGRARGATVRCGHKDDEETPGIAAYDDNDDALAALDQGDIQVLGGTAWLWSREDARGAVDVLVVDEAGQFSLANTLAVAQAADSLVLIGDPRQLEQPIKGTHPDGAALSALDHLLGDATTVRPERGLFLGETHRLHPSLCALTSELFYDGRLHPRPGRERQRLQGTHGFDRPGPWLAPVPHEGNQSHSPEEVEAIKALVDRLLVPGATWTDPDGEIQPLRIADILIVAPYNAQVNKLAQRLPHFRIGTVDKFQGQEAPIVLISLSSSTPEDAPRGMEFLYSPNRFNVATSRARCTCILVASPKLFEPECRTPRQMRLANAFCRYLEVAERVETSPAALN